MNVAKHPSQAVDSEFERCTRSALVASAESLPGVTRSRLTQARFAALAARQSRTRYRLQRWAPAGAAAVAAVALLVMFVPHALQAPVNPLANGALEDLDVLASDVPLSADQDVDYDFYEWAVGEANHGAAAGAGSGAAGAPSAGV